MNNPIFAIGLLHRGLPGKKRFLGTCFSFRRRTRFLTAAHCIRGIPVEELWLTAPLHGVAVGQGLQVRFHPTIDLAVIRNPLFQVPGREIDPFDVVAERPNFSEDIWAFGFPAEPLGEDRHEANERLFKGHIQRILSPHRGLSGNEYEGAELSFSSPAGLSGGPIFRPRPPWDLLGIVTENIESKTYLEESEEVVFESRTEVTRYQRVVSYGVAASLGPAFDWLDRMATEPTPGTDPNVNDPLPEE